MSRDGSRARVLVSAVLDGQIAWAPDGRTSGTNNTRSSTAYPLHGGSPTPLLRHDGGLGGPSGTRIM